MSVSLTPVVTLAGLQAVFNATNDGLQARISHVALGDLGWSPNNQATGLRRERRRVAVSNGSRINPTQIHVTAVEDGSTEYWVREVGFFLDDGTLLAIWSHPTQALAYKAGDVDLLLAFDMVLSALPADSVIVEGTGGVNLAPATTSKEGVVRLAATNEARAGALSTAVVMTPAGSRVHGDARYSRLGHRHAWGEIDGKPASYPPSTHNHDTRYIRPANLRMTSGFVRTNNRHSQVGWAGYNDWTRNYADIFPPYGFTMSHLQGFNASIGIIYFAGNVNDDDNLYLRWRRQTDRVRVICANSENRANTSGIGSYLNYLAIWRK